MKNLFVWIILISEAATGTSYAQESLNWNNSPQNWQNSPDNWDNSPQNWNNSPQNWINNPNNFNATNGVFDNQGRQIGYEVQTPTGVTNIYSTDGRRMGYVPAQQR